MKLYMVIYLAGQIVGTVGPLPYDAKLCEQRAAEKMAEADHTVTTPEGFTTKDVRLTCEWHAIRPENQR